MHTIPYLYTYRFKKRISRLLACFLLFGILCVAMPAFATVDEEDTSVSIGEAKAALLVEATTQQVLLEENAQALSGVAGLSKLPALLVLCEAVDKGKLDLKAEIAVSRNAAGVSGPTAFIEGGEVIDAAQLMKAAVMIGAGDALMAMGEHVYGTELAFLDAIHARLLALSIPATLNDPIGIGTPFSASMLALIGAKLMESDCFVEYGKLTLEQITHADGRNTELANANRLLRNYAGCGGILTGSSPSDGYSGVFSVQRGDTHLIAVVIGCKNSSLRFQTATNMLDQAFATTRAQKLSERDEVLKENIRVKGGVVREVNLVARETIVLLLDKTAPALEAVEDIPDQLHAPLTRGEVVGTIAYQSAEGEVHARVELIVETAVEAYSYREIISAILSVFLCK